MGMCSAEQAFNNLTLLYRLLSLFLQGAGSPDGAKAEEGCRLKAFRIGLALSAVSVIAVSCQIGAPGMGGGSGGGNSKTGALVVHLPTSLQELK